METQVKMRSKACNSKCCQKDGAPNKKIRAECNQIMAGVVCVVGFCFIVILVLIDGFTEERILHNRVQTSESSLPENPRCEVKSCEIVCEGLSLREHNVRAIIEAAFKKMNHTKCGNTVSKIDIKFLSVPDSALPQHWFDSSLFTVKSLTISSDSIRKIDNGAFRATVFQNVNDLCLDNVQLEVWDESNLEGFSKLKELSLRHCGAAEIRANVLRHVAATLESLQIQDTTHVLNPQNITGSVNLPSLKIIDFRYNTNGLALNRLSFTGAKLAEAVHLDRSNLGHMGEGTFAPMSYLGKLFIHDNQLRTLRRDVFGELLPSFKMQIYGNAWECDCDLEWLMALKKKNQLLGVTKCTLPCDCDFEDVDFCPDNVTVIPTSAVTTTITTTTATKTTIKENETTPPLLPNTTTSFQTTAIGDHFVELFCSNGATNGGGGCEFKTDALIPRQTVDFDIQDRGPGLVRISVTSELAENDMLVWFNSDTMLADLINMSRSIGCAMNLTRRIVLDKLAPGETYSFCFVREMESKISPLNCRAHITEKPWERRTWLVNESRPTVYAIFGAGLAACVLCGALLAYCLVRAHPTLLRGSKRVLVVKHKSADAIVLPPAFRESGLRESRDKPKMPPFRRSVSELSINSMRSADASYVSAAEPTTAQLLNWRLEKLRSRMTHDCVIRENSLGVAQKPQPPPLPPPNLAERPYSPSSTASHYESIANVRAD